MTCAFLQTLYSNYCKYVDQFREPCGTLSHMHQLKVEHTEQVVANARLLMNGEAWLESRVWVGEACALLHDIGRHVQLRDYGTFRDADSIDHAVCGVKVIQQEGLLDTLDRQSRADITVAVALHNRIGVPCGVRPRVAHLAHLVRDADKLDIFRVLETVIADGSLVEHPEISWGLQVNGPPSPFVVESVCAGSPVGYGDVKNLSDFILIQIGWLISGFHYTTSLRLAAEREVISYREAFLKTLSNDPAIARCCAVAREHINRTVRLK